MTMKLIIAIMLALMPLQATSPEEMYDAYITPQTRELLDEFDRIEEDIRNAENAERNKRNIAITFSILIGLIPLAYTLRQIIRARTWEVSVAGTAKAIGISLLGGAVLFGLNYGIFMLKIKMGDAFNTSLAFLLVAIIIAGAIWLLTKKDSTYQKNQ